MFFSEVVLNRSSLGLAKDKSEIFMEQNKASFQMRANGRKKPLAQVFRDGNSGNRFVTELSKSEDKLFNKSFDSAQSLLARKPNLKQTQICVRRSLKRTLDTPSCSFTTAEQLETKTELFLMPMPKAKAMREKVKLNNTVCGGEILENPPKLVKEPVSSKEVQRSEASSADPLDQTQRNMKVFVGNVGFVVQMAKSYPKLNTLWDVYGKVIRISQGKHRYEHQLLLRNIDDSGPILQCSYFDFNKTLESIAIGSNVRLVGNLMGYNCLRTFKIEVLNRPIIQSNFMRIQNVNSFVLLQNRTSNETK